MSQDFWAALSLVLVIEGLFLFAAPGAWKQAVTQMLAQPEPRLRNVGAAMMIVGLLALYAVRGG